MIKRNLYLNNIPVEEAMEKYLAALGGLLPGFEEISVSESLGRVTRKAVYAACCSPLFNAAAMDGIAVKAGDTSSARESSPLSLTLDKDFILIDTGDPINPPYDAVIMAEDVIEDETRANTVKIIEPTVAWQNVRPIGEDIVTGEMILPSRHCIRPIDIGALLSGGVSRVEVYKKPRTAIFPTGTELVEADKIDTSPNAPSGQIIESNSRMIEAMVNSEGGTGTRFSPIPDNHDLIKKAIMDAVEKFDIVMINAGSSAGREDYTVHVLKELGEIIVHGVAIKPGKPVILAVVKNKPVIGIPGYPVSAWIAYKNFVSPLIGRLTGLPDKPPEKVEAFMAKRLVSSLKHREYVRVKIGLVDGKLVASPLARGAGTNMSLVRADGFCVIDQNKEGIEAGESAPVELYRPLGEIESTLVSIGSHDLIIDIIADSLSNRQDAFLASTHVGSMGGLMALKRGECHVAPIHLLDEETGDYNTSYIKRAFYNEETKTCGVSLIKGVGRIQGLIVAKGNPLGIKEIKDLPQYRYINRQRGAGTRLLLDYELKRNGIETTMIEGYEREGATHMAVAAAVKNGSADAGMGILSAASALDLDFIPMGEEEYDFAILTRFLKLPQLKAFLEVLGSSGFHKRLDELGGYSYKRTGEILNL